MKSIHYLLSLAFLLFANNVLAQDDTNKLKANKTNKDKTIQVKFIEAPEIKIDGVLDEAEWEQAETTSDFWENFPSDKDLAKEQTEIRMIYNSKNHTFLEGGFG